MDPRQHLQALQSEVAAAREASKAGDRTRALEHLDRALSIDPSFLAAQSLRERLLAGPEPASAPVPATPAVRRGASKEAHARIERRARQRRVDYCIASARAALGRRQLDEAAAAIDELIALEPGESNVSSLSAELADLRRRGSRRPFGARMAAAAAFAIVAGGATWLERPRHSATVTLASTPIETRLPPSAPPPEAADSAARTDAGPAGHSATPQVADSSKIASAAILPATEPAVEPAPRAIAAPVPVRPAAALPPVTAPIDLPTPLSQLPGVAQPASQEPPLHEVSPASVPVVEPLGAGGGPGDQQLVEEALQRYRRAYGRLNVQSALAVYPGVNRVALARAFDGLESQALTFNSCDVELNGASARAICHGSARYVPKFGAREARVEPLIWSFELRKSAGDWTIESAKASR